MPAEPNTGRRFINDIRGAVRSGKLHQRFRAAAVRRAYPGWGQRMYSNFVPKYRVATRSPGPSSESIRSALHPACDDR